MTDAHRVGRLGPHSLCRAHVYLRRLDGDSKASCPQAHGQTSPVWYPLFYTAKVVIVALLAWHYRAVWKDFLPVPSLAKLGLSVLLGLLIWGIWIGLDGRYPALPLLGGGRSEFNPGVMAPPARWAFIAVRMLGLCRPRARDRGAVLAVVPDALADRSGYFRRCR